jgi:hypothetical protein
MITRIIRSVQNQILLLCFFGIRLSAEAAVFTNSVGPFDIRFYNSGDTTVTGVTGEQDWTLEQVDAVSDSVAEWTRLINNIAARRIALDYAWVSFTGNTLGGATSNRAYDGNNSFTMTELTWKAGYNLPSTWDGLVRYDISAAGTEAWHFGSAATPNDKIDFRSVVTHEMGHLMGFYSTYKRTVSDPDGGTVTLNQFGTDAWYNDGWYWEPRGLSAWDRNLIDLSGNRPELGTLDQEYPVPTAFDVEGNPAYWDGADAIAYNGGELVEIYAPSNYAPGSSLSHLNGENDPVYENSLMDPYTSFGESPRTVSGLELAMMKDMGWDVIPEPSVTLMALFICGAAFWIRRRFYD